MRLRQKYKNAKKEIERLKRLDLHINNVYIKTTVRNTVKYKAVYSPPDDFCPREYVERILAEKFLPAILENMKVDVEYYHTITNHPVYTATVMFVDLKGKTDISETG